MPKVTSAHLRARGPLWYVDIRTDDGGRIQRTTGFRLSQEAEALAAKEEAVRLIEAGGEAVSPGVWTVRRWGEHWTDDRRDLGKGSWKQEKTHLGFYLYPEFGNRPLREVTKAEMIAWAKALPKHLRHDAKAPGERISARTAHNIANTVRSMWKAAAKIDLVAVSPAAWDATDLPPKDEKRDLDRAEGGFDLEQVFALLTDLRIPVDRRVLYAMEFLTGMRTGEAAMRRIRDWRPEKKPLGMLRAWTAWSTEHRIEKVTKTRARKYLPVHPFLARVLKHWIASGWEKTYGRTPTPDDLIVPAARGGPRHSGYSAGRFAVDLEKLGLEHQIHYETRSTFRSLALAGGADIGALDLITHPSPKQAKDLYRRLPLLWPKMCDAVLAIRLPTVTTKSARNGPKRASSGSKRASR